MSLVRSFLLLIVFSLSQSALAQTSPEHVARDSGADDSRAGYSQSADAEPDCARARRRRRRREAQKNGKRSWLRHPASR